MLVRYGEHTALLLPQSVTEAQALVSRVLGPLIAHDTGHGTAYVDTLRAVLESPGLNEAATRLGVHRNTVAHRIARLEQLADWDLSDPDLRFALGLALRIVHDAQSGEEQRY